MCGLRPIFFNPRTHFYTSVGALLVYDVAKHPSYDNVERQAQLLCPFCNVYKQVSGLTVFLTGGLRSYAITLITGRKSLQLCRVASSSICRPSAICRLIVLSMSFLYLTLNCDIIVTLFCSIVIMLVGNKVITHRISRVMLRTSQVTHHMSSARVSRCRRAI